MSTTISTSSEGFDCRSVRGLVNVPDVIVDHGEFVARAHQEGVVEPAVADVVTERGEKTAANNRQNAMCQIAQRERDEA